ncbi:hypothetical protein BsWGS_09097 [Bradybaena similaris]
MNTEVLLSSLAGGATSVKLLPGQTPTETESAAKSAPPPDVKTCPAVPAITIEMDLEDPFLNHGRQTRSFSVGTDIDARGLRNLLLSQKNSRMTLSKYDRNLTETENIQTEIRKKTTKNRRLERLFSQDVTASSSERRKSWSCSDTVLGTERAHTHRAPPRHSMTLDLGSAGHHGAGDASAALGFAPPLSPPLDAVFEEEEEVESRPMIGKYDKKLSRGSMKSSKYKLERQMGLDKTGVTDGQSALPQQEKVDMQNMPSDTSEESGQRSRVRRFKRSETDV